MGEVADTRFSLWERRPEQISVRETRVTQHGPTGTITNPVLEFVISGTGEGWIDLGSSFFTIEGGLMELDNTSSKRRPIKPNARGVTLETNFADMLFEDVKVYLNGVDVSDDTNNLLGMASFARKALTQDGSYAKAGSLAVAALPPDVYRQDSVGSPVGIDINTYTVPRLGVLAMSLGPGAEEGCVINSGTLNPDAPRSMMTDENFCDWTADFARGAKHRGVSSGDLGRTASATETTVVTSGARTPVDRPSAAWRFSPKLGIWMQGKVLPPNTDLRITCKKAPDALVVHRDIPPDAELGGTATALNFFHSSAFNPALGLQDADSYHPVIFDWGGADADGDSGVTFTPKIKPARMILNLVRVYPTDSLKQAVAASMLMQPAMYNIMRARVQPVTIPSGVVTLDQIGLFSGVRPEVVVVMIPATRSIIGEMCMSPFFCSSLPVANPGRQLQKLAASPDPDIYITPKVQEIYVTWGARQLPQRPYHNLDESGAMRAYVEGYLKNTYGGSSGHGDGPFLSYAAWRSNYTLWVFNLNRGESLPGELAPAITDVGSMELHLRLSGTTNFENTAVVIGFSGAIVEIDVKRNVNRIAF